MSITKRARATTDLTTLPPEDTVGWGGIAANDLPESRKLAQGGLRFCHTNRLDTRDEGA